MKPAIACSLVSFLLSFSATGFAQEAPVLTVEIVAGSKAARAGNRSLVESLIGYALTESKAFEILEPFNVRLPPGGSGQEGDARVPPMGGGDADVRLTYEVLPNKQPDGGISFGLSVEAVEPYSGKILAKAVAMSAPRAGGPGSENASLSEAVNQAMEQVVTQLKASAKRMAERGRSIVIQLIDPPKAADAAIREVLGKTCTDLTGAGGTAEQVRLVAVCKQDPMALTEQLRAALAGKVPDAGYEIPVKSKSMIVFQFEKAAPLPKKGPPKRGNKTR